MGDNDNDSPLERKKTKKANAEWRNLSVCDRIVTVCISAFFCVFILWWFFVINGIVLVCLGVITHALQESESAPIMLLQLQEKIEYVLKY